MSQIKYTCPHCNSAETFIKEVTTGLSRTSLVTGAYEITETSGLLELEYGHTFFSDGEQNYYVCGVCGVKITDDVRELRKYLVTESANQSK